MINNWIENRILYINFYISKIVSNNWKYSNSKFSLTAELWLMSFEFNILPNNEIKFLQFFWLGRSTQNTKDIPWYAFGSEHNKYISQTMILARHSGFYYIYPLKVRLRVVSIVFLSLLFTILNMVFLSTHCNMHCVSHTSASDALALHPLVRWLWI